MTRTATPDSDNDPGTQNGSAARGAMAQSNDNYLVSWLTFATALLILLNETEVLSAETALLAFLPFGLLAVVDFFGGLYDAVIEAYAHHGGPDV